MKFATTLVSATAVMAVGVFAEPIPLDIRALSDYQAVLTTVTNQVDLVDSDVDGYVAGTVAGTTVLADGSDLVTVINTAATDVSGFAALGLLDALGLVTPINDLVDEVESLITKLINAEPQVAADGYKADTLAVLTSLKTAAEGLRDAIVPKVPSAVQSTAESTANQIVTDIQSAITAYS